MAPSVYHRDTCRLCGSKDVPLALGLAPTAIADAYIPKEKLKDPQPLYPLDLYLCRGCGHVQMLDVIPPDILFKDYTYVSASSMKLDEHFERYADEVMKAEKIPSNGFAVDIGSNDGTLLRFFKAKGMRILGVDPAREIAGQATASGIETLPSYFTVDVAQTIKSKYGAPDLITANNVFAHADDMGEVAEGVKCLLGSNGVFVFEVSYLLDLMEGMVFDFAYHEHLCHHSVKPLRKFLKAHGLELIDVKRVPTKGGSIRGVAQLAGGPKPISPTVAAFIKAEDAYGLETLGVYEAFAKKILAAKKKVLDAIADFRSKGKTVAAYGASATSTTLIYHFDLGDKLSFIFDDNPQKQNLFSPGFHIPVLPSKEIYIRKPDVILLLAWRYADPILKKHQAYLDQGGHFIRPLPNFEVI